MKIKSIVNGLFCGVLLLSATQEVSAFGESVTDRVPDFMTGKAACFGYGIALSVTLMLLLIKKTSIFNNLTYEINSSESRPKYQVITLHNMPLNDKYHLFSQYGSKIDGNKVILTSISEDYYSDISDE